MRKLRCCCCCLRGPSTVLSSTRPSLRGTAWPTPEPCCRRRGSRTRPPARRASRPGQKRKQGKGTNGIHAVIAVIARIGNIRGRRQGGGGGRRRASARAINNIAAQHRAAQSFRIIVRFPVRSMHNQRQGLACRGPGRRRARRCALPTARRSKSCSRSPGRRARRAATRCAARDSGPRARETARCR